MAQSSGRSPNILPEFERTRSLEAAWNNAKKKAGLGHLKTTLYEGTKHSWGTRAVNDGVDLNRIQAAKGHSTSDMTRRYARLKAEGLRSVMEKMEGSNCAPFVHQKTEDAGNETV
jgi:site-specific recombinase XerD